MMPHAIGPQLTNKSSKSAPTAGDPSDGGPKEPPILVTSNVYGSSRYMQFLAGLGTLVPLRDCPPTEIYIGGLDRNGADGEFAYSWQDDICQGKNKLPFLNKCLFGLMGYYYFI